MKMRKLTALALSAALALSLCAAVPAAEHMSNFQKTASYAGNFKDVWSGAWYAESAKICYEYGLMQGTYGKFNPRGTVSVAEALTLSCRIHEVYNNGKSIVKSGSGANWYRPYVEYAVKEGLIQAEDFDDYTRAATRAEVAYLFADALPPAELHAVNRIDHLTDVPQGKYYHSILLLYNAGVLTGSGPECAFRPEETITRAELSALAARMILPKERKHFVVLDRQDLPDLIGGLTVYLPGSRDAQSTEGRAGLTSASGAYRCEAAVRTVEGLNPAKPVVQYTKGEVKELLEQDLQTLGYVVNIASVSAKDVAFGSVPAYRYEFRAADSSGNNRLCFAYAFVRGGKLCTVSYLTVRDSTEFRAAIDALTLDGAAHT